MSIKFFGLNLNFSTLIVAIIALLYLFLLANEIVYNWKNYKDDKNDLLDQNKRKVAGVRTNTYRNGTARYAPELAEGEVKGEKNFGLKKLQRLKREYKYKQIKSVITCFRQILK